MNVRQLTIWIGLPVLVWAFCFASSAHAQGRIEAEAVAGEPFGVGRITFDLSPSMVSSPLGIDGILLSEKNARVLYPTLDNPAFGKLMREILDSETPLTTGGPVRREVGGILRGVLAAREAAGTRTTLYFLFRGAEPLDLTLDLALTSRGPIPLTIVPRVDPIAHRRLLELWWKQYSKPANLFEPKPDYPPVVDNYLMATLARRLNLRLPEDKQTKSPYAELRKEIGFNLGTESLRMAMQQDRILGLNNLDEPADQPLPKPLDPPPLEVPEPANNVSIEPMAMRVPAQCFYVRFGSFANFLWLQDTLAKWGGDWQNLIALRGLDRGTSSGIETQLVLKQTVLSRMLGDTVIADVAIIGNDMFFHEGASYGILFHARNNLALSASIVQQRQERIKAGGVTEEKLKIDSHDVSYLTSSDGAVRSYYVVEGDFHFVTTSRSLVSQFLATASGKDALGATEEFRHARTIMPISRDDTIWLYASDAFFRAITGPHYRIEMARRLQAMADIELVQLAKLAAVAEAKPGTTIDELKAASLLPPEFGPLPDGSRTVLDGDEAYDSIRGRRGSFVPISDMTVGAVIAAELSEYNKFADYYRSNWGRIDPIIAGIKRTPLKDNREQVVVDVLMTPFAPQHFTSLRQWLGPADQRQLTPIAGDMAALELVLAEQRVFAGLRDVGRPQPAGMATWLPTGRLRDFVVGYIGTTGELGWLSVLNIGIPPQSDPAGYAVSPLNGWRRHFGDFTVFSFQRDVLAEVTPQLRFEEAKRPAQIRLRVDDVSRARITPALNDLGYARTRETSLGNLRLLQALQQQLHVPAAECKTTAEDLLGAKLICPLGGEYVLRDEPGESPHWTSTALRPVEPSESGRVHAPQGYLSPPLNWFRGLDLDATMTETTTSAHAEIIMQMPAKK